MQCKCKEEPWKNLLWICLRLKSVATAKLLLSQDWIDMGVSNRNGDTALFVLMKNVNNSNVRTATDILNEFFKHPNINDIVQMHDRDGLNLLEMFLCNKSVLLMIKIYH